MTPEAMALTHAAAFAPARGWSEAEFADLLADPHVILCVDGPAFLLARLIADEAEILTLATPPEARRRGHAGRALARFHAEIAVRRAQRAFLEVAEDNAAARALYDGAGYVRVGQRRGYYARPGGRSVDALTMAREIVPAAD